MAFKSISEIMPTHDAEPIQVRVLKKWIPHNQNTDLCYLFVDENRGAIHVTCLLADESYFDKLITVKSCYIVNEYIPMPQQSYMPACPHEASLIIGKRATFEQIHNDNIPSHYYCFATYADLPARSVMPKMLTDYIEKQGDAGNRAMEEPSHHLFICFHTMH